MADWFKVGADLWFHTSPKHGGQRFEKGPLAITGDRPIGMVTTCGLAFENGGQPLTLSHVQDDEELGDAVGDAACADCLARQRGLGRSS